MNPNIIYQHSQQYGSKCQIEPGRRAPEFEPFIENEGIETGNGELYTKIKKAETANVKIADCKSKSEKKTVPVQKYSNHIEFIDYIPTYEVITYRHLFAYGFYVV